jgi:hypothetical protein
VGRPRLRPSEAGPSSQMQGHGKEPGAAACVQFHPCGSHGDDPAENRLPTEHEPGRPANLALEDAAETAAKWAVRPISGHSKAAIRLLMASFDGPPPVRSWFSEDELKLCPYCHEQAAVPTEPGPSVCLACEAVWIETPGSAPQRTA